MSVLLVSTIIGTLCFIIAYFVISNTTDIINTKFNDNLNSKLLINVNNVNKDIVADKLPISQETVLLGSSVHNLDKTHKELNNKFDDAHNQFIEINDKYHDNVSKNYNLKNELTEKLRLNPLDGVRFSIESMNLQNKNSKENLDAIDIKNSQQSDLINTLSNNLENHTKKQNNIKNEINKVNSAYTNISDISKYVKNIVYKQTINEWNQYKENINGGFNTLDSIYANRNTLIPIIDYGNNNKNQLNNVTGRLSEVERNYYRKDQLDDIDFPLELNQIDPNIFKNIERTSIKANNVTKKLNTEVPSMYIKKKEFTDANQNMKNINFPMLQFLYGSKMNINGITGFGNNNPEYKLHLKDNSTNWSSIVQNNNTNINISKGDGNGLAINTKNNEGNKSSVKIVNHSTTLLDANNNGNVEMNNQINLNKLSSTSQICINDTCVTKADLDKIPKIIIKPPVFTRPNQFELHSVVVYNLNNYFTDKSGNLTYELIYNPHNNAQLVGNNLYIYGAYRDTTYDVGIRATNNFHSIITDTRFGSGRTEGYFPILEPKIIHCEMNPWQDPNNPNTEWGPCNKYSGLRTSIRTVKVEPKNGGTPCPTDRIKYKTCPVDCEVGPWSQWGECDKSSGLQKKNRREIISAKNGGAACPPLEESKPCPVNCEWNDWGECSNTCGTGTRWRTKRVTAKNGGAECVGPDSEACWRNHGCCIMGNWGAWSGCHGGCGGGTQYRSRPITRDGIGCGHTSESQGCSTYPCPVDCQAHWSNAGGKCVAWERRYRYNITQHGAHGGRSCYHGDGHTSGCRTHAPSELYR